MNDSAARLAIVASHPVQYYAPWFRLLATRVPEFRVFYLWGGGHDPGFGREIRWDLDLLSGYDHEFVPNSAARPGTDHFHGLTNPSLPARLRAWRPDAVLVFGYGWHALARLALTWRDCPLVLRGDTHLMGRETTSGWKQRARNLLLPPLLGRYRAFASVGAAHTRFLVEQRVPPSRIFHVPHCVDNERWSAQTEAARADGPALRARLGIPPGNRLVLFAGKFEPKKRPDLLISAFRQAAVPATSLLLVGDGPLAASLQTAAANARDIHFLPFQNQQELPAVFAAADLLVLPSEGPGETWGLIVNEAMAAGIPCIVSDHVGCREDLVVENVTGWSFPHGDADALAARLTTAVDALAQRGESLRRSVRERIAAYDYDTAASALLGALAAIAPPFKV